MNEEQKKSAMKSKRIGRTFEEVMGHLKLTQNEECSVIINLLIAYLIKWKSDPKSFLEWISNAVPVVIKNWHKTGFGHISGDGENTKIELIDNPGKET